MEEQELDEIEQQAMSQLTEHASTIATRASVWLTDDDASDRFQVCMLHLFSPLHHEHFTGPDLPRLVAHVIEQTCQWPGMPEGFWQSTALAMDAHEIDLPSQEPVQHPTVKRYTTTPIPESSLELMYHNLNPN